MRVYLDHNATTPMRPEVRRRIEELLDGDLGGGLGNPSSLHASGRRARQVIDEARMQVAAALGVHEDALTFTSGGTESNNLALFGGMARARPGAALVVTRIEHSSVLGPAEELARRGSDVRFVGVDRQGRVDLDQLEAAARGARLVSVMAANNEIGVCPSLEAVAERLGPKEGRPLLHSDAAQALGRIEVPWSALDLATLSGHKFGGPIGLGILVHRPGVALEPRTHGGGQELGLRPGTEPAAAIAGLALAVELACRERSALAARLDALARTLWSGVSARVPGIELLGPPLADRGPQPDRLPGTLNLLQPDVDGKVLLTKLDLEGLEVSAGSACASGSLEPSHVLLALGLGERRARAGLRVSLGRTTREEDVHIAVEILGRTLGFPRAR